MGLWQATQVNLTALRNKLARVLEFSIITLFGGSPSLNTELQLRPTSLPHGLTQPNNVRPIQNDIIAI